MQVTVLDYQHVFTLRLTTVTVVQLLSCLQRIIGPVLLYFTNSSSSVSTRKEGEISTNSRGPTPDYIAYVFVFLGSIIICRLYKVTLSA
jgi:hypothetical protein